MKLFLFEKDGFIKFFLVFDEMKNNPSQLVSGGCNSLWCALTNPHSTEVTDLLFHRALAAIRSAWAARLEPGRVHEDKIFPPLILFFGLSPSHEQKWFAFLNLERSGPTSAKMTCAVNSLMPSIWVKSVPKRRCMCVFKSKFGVLALVLRLFRIDGDEEELSISMRDSNSFKWLSISVSQSRINCWQLR